jgi:hypothetical protein
VRWTPGWELSSRVESSTVGSQLGSCSEIGDGQRGREAVDMEAEGYMALEAVTRQRLVKKQQTEKI